MKNNLNESGRSMIEMLGVLAIIGVLSVGGIAGYSKAMSKYRINKTVEQITLIAGNVRSFFAPQKNYDGLSSTVIRKAKLIPEDMWDTNGTGFTNVFGYHVAVHTQNKSNSGDRQAFYITYRIGDNLEACIELLTHDWTSANVGFISVGGPGGSAALKTPIALDKAVEECENIINKNKPYGSGLPEITFSTST